MSRLGHASGANPKGAHYIANLGAALVRGAWRDANPGATPNGSGLSWSELIRKWGKHTGGNTEVVHALRTIALCDLTSRGPTSATAVHNAGGVSTSAEPGSASAAAQAPRDGVNGPSQPKSHRGGKDTDGADGASDEAWVEGSNWARQPLDSRSAEEVTAAGNRLRSLTGSATLSAAEQSSAALTLAYGLYALSDYDGALSAYGSFGWASDPTSGLVVGDAAVVERIRARTIQGMCFELSSRPDTSLAHQCYVEAVKLADKLSPSPLPTPAYLQPASGSATAARPPMPSPSSGEAQREAMRYLSTALTRATAITARTPDLQLTLRILRTYHALAAAWPSNFRPRQRQRMLNIYLAALLESYPPAGATVPEPYLLNGGSATRTARATWRAEVVESLRYGQRMLGDTTSFPTAGALNVPVVQFADQVSLFPDLAPALTRDAITILWWSTNLTFQSQLILRRLTCLLATTSDTVEAKRVFELYVDTVLKARLTENPDSTLALRRHTSIEDGELTGNPNDEAPANGHTESTAQYGEFDSDTELVSTLLVGCRFLLSDLNEPKEAWRYATLAGDVAAQGHISRKVLAQVEENKGVVRQVMSTNGADRVQRPKYQAQAINHLRRATVLDPDSARSFYHLAYAEASARNIQPALQAVRESLELDSHSVRAWHLLALLLTASGDWEGAYKACEAGVALWESDDESLSAEEGDVPGVGANGHTPAPRPLLDSRGVLAPLAPILAAPPSRFRRLESVIQLRMTLNVITEKLRGGDVALAQGKDLFLFFSQRTEKGEYRERPRSGISTHAPSTRTGRSPVPTAPTDVHVQAPSPTPGSASRGLSPPRIATTSPPVEPAPSVEAETGSGTGSRSHKKSLIQKHLHVPAVARTHSRTVSAPTSLRPADIGPSSRAASGTGSMMGAPSIAPTAVHSHYHGAGGRSAPPPPLKSVVRRSPAEERILSNLWLMSAASFRRAGKLEQALVAIEEAETRDPENPAVWVQLGLWHRAMTSSTGVEVDPHGEALAAFTKSLLLRPDYPPGAVSVARLHLATGSVDLAHSLLSQLVQDRGWDIPEAWFSLASVCERQDRHARARECLLYALSLERTRTCRSLDDALPRWSE